MFHKLTSKHSWFCFVIISRWCQADCKAEANTFISLDYMVVGNHFLCLGCYGFFVLELVEEYIKMLQGDHSMKQLNVVAQLLAQRHKQLS